MNYTRQYENRINWQNTPSVSTPINATNLNKMDNALNYMDGKMAEVVGTINEFSTLAGIGKKTSYDSSEHVIDTNVLLYRAPKVGDRILVYFDSKIDDPYYLKLYGVNSSDPYSIFLGAHTSDYYLNGLCLFEVIEYMGESLALNLIYRDLGVYDAGTGISIRNGTITNSMPQRGDDIKGYDITNDISSGNLGSFGLIDDYIILNFKANALPDGSGKYHAFLSSSSGGVLIMKYAVLKKLDGTFYSENIYTGMSLICKSNDGGIGTEADPIVLTVIAVNNGYVNVGREANTPYGEKSTAEGHNNTAMGITAHVGGSNSSAAGNYSFAHGDHVSALQNYQAVFGSYNEAKPNTLLEIGNGSFQSGYSNAFEVTNDGHAIDGQGNDLASVAALEASASGNPIIVNAQNVMAKELSVTLLPDQNLNGYDAAWKGGGGKNKFDVDSVTAMGSAVVSKSGTKVSISGNATYLSFSSSHYVLKANTTYTVSCHIKPITIATGWTPRITIRNTSNQILESAYTSVETDLSFSYTPTEDVEVYVSGVISGATASAAECEFDNIQLEEGGSATSYESYSNICPISGRTETSVQSEGNLLNMEELAASSGVTKTISGNRLTISADGTSATYQGLNLGNTQNLKFKAGTYYVKAKVVSISNAAYNAIGFRNSSNLFIVSRSVSVGNLAFTAVLTEDCYFSLLLNSTGSNRANTMVIEDIIISRADVPFVPYEAPSSATIAFGQTIYAAKVDFKTGKVSGIWAYGSITSFNSKSSSTAVDQYLQGVTPTSFEHLPFCNMATPANTTELFSATRKDVRIGFANDTPNILRVSFPLSMGIDTKEKADAYISNGLQYCYPLATPPELTLTPAQLELLKGYNYITGDGEMSMVYIPESILPTAPTTDGTYRLICTVTDGKPSFSWAAN